MAQVPKLTAAPTAPSWHTSRVTSPARVATTGHLPLEEASATEPSHRDAAPFGFQESQRDLTSQGQGQQRRQHSGILNAPSQAFAALLEYEAPVTTSAGSPDAVRERAFAGVVAKAIEAYETNARVMHGENPMTGTQISLTL